MIIKTVKLTKTLPVQLTSFTQNSSGDEIDYIQSNDYQMKWKLSTLNDDNISLEELTYNQNVSLQKIEHFVRNYLNNSLWFEKDGTNMANIHLSSTENMLLVTPVLNFTCLGLCLYAKLNSLCKPGIVVTDLYLNDLMADQSFEYADLDGELPESLPNQDEFMGDLSVWDTVWWCRDDLSTYDNMAVDTDEQERVRKEILVAEEAILSDFDYIEDQVRQLLTPENEAEIIEINFAELKEKMKWKPKLVK